MDGSGRSKELVADGFGARVRAAIAWRWGSQLVAQCITWGSTIMVVRLLQPSDYGLFAMSQAIVTALNFLNGWSFASSLIQKDDVSERDMGQAMALLLIANGALAAAQFCIAPFVADYYGQPVVAELLRVQALIFLTIPFAALPASLLSRRLEFRSQGIANLASAIVGALTALGLAWYGFGVWALIYAPILAFAVRGLVLMFCARAWVWPQFDLRGAGRMIGFGGALTAVQLFWIIQSQSDIFIAGRLFDAHELGLYSEALFLTLIVTGRFIPPLNEVAYPAYAELHKKHLSLAPYFERTVQTVLLVTAPIYVGLSLTAPEAIFVLFGEKWTEMAPLVAGLALAMPAMAVQIMCSPVVTSTGRERIYLITSIAGAAIFVTCFLIGVRFGAMGLVHAWWVGAPLLLLFTLMLILPVAGLSWARIALAAVPAMVSSAIMACAVIGVRSLLPNLHPALVLSILAATGASAYAASLWIFFRSTTLATISLLRNPRAVPQAEASIPLS